MTYQRNILNFVTCFICNISCSLIIKKLTNNRKNYTRNTDKDSDYWIDVIIIKNSCIVHYLNNI